MTPQVPILVTGCAGFIGMWVVLRLLEEGHWVVGVDNLNDYYDVRLKQDRLAQLVHPHFSFYHLDISDSAAFNAFWHEIQPQQVIHLAAQAGVRYSLDHPLAYIQSNLVGFFNVLEACRHQSRTPEGFAHLVYASSSSVYGGNTLMPFVESAPLQEPLSLYGATKGSNELMAQSYCHLYQIPITGLRFFTVYGPWGRPDMAYFKFTKAIVEGLPLSLYNYGNMKRDFTFIEDIVDGVVAALKRVPGDNGNKPYTLYNLGNDKPEDLFYLVSLIERAVGKSAIIEKLPLQAGDVPETHAHIGVARKYLGYDPQMSLEKGISSFVDWYLSYYEKRMPLKKRVVF